MWPPWCHQNHDQPGFTSAQLLGKMVSPHDLTWGAKGKKYCWIRKNHVWKKRGRSSVSALLQRDNKIKDFYSLLFYLWLRGERAPRILLSGWKALQALPPTRRSLGIPELFDLSNLYSHLWACPCSSVTQPQTCSIFKRQMASLQFLNTSHKHHHKARRLYTWMCV